MSDSFYLKELSLESLVPVLKDKVEKLNQANHQLKHDVREQLFVIRNSIQILKMREYKNFDLKTKTDFDRMERAVARLEYKVDSHFEKRAATHLTSGKLLLSSLIHSVLDRMHIPKAVTVDIFGDSVAIECDQRKLQIVFLNLVLNAIQAMKSKGKVDIDIEDQGSFVTVSVQDSGPGVSPEKSKKVFDPNYTTRPKGTGLGLASCKTIVEQHGGTIKLQPKRGRGANFVISLPKSQKW